MVQEIELHPGHWKNEGSGANGGINEVREARKVTKRVYEILQASNVPSTYFEDNTSSNQAQNLNTLVKHHNQDKNGLVVSIHFNASSGTSTKGIGTEVLYKDQRALAEKVAKAISDVSGLRNRGAKQRYNLAVLANTYEPAILIEVCFVNDTVDVALYRRDFDKICYAIAECLAEYIGKPLKEGEEMKFSSPSLKAETELTLNSKARRTMIVDAAFKAGAHESWLTKHEKGEMTEADYLGLAAKAVIDPQL